CCGVNAANHPPVGGEVQTAFLLSLLFPPPTPGTFRLTGSDGTRTRCATDRQESAIMQGIVGHIVRTNKIDDVFALPIKQWIDLDKIAVFVERRHRRLRTLGGLLRAQSRDPARGVGKGASKRDDFANITTSASPGERRSKPVDPLPSNKRFDLVLFGHKGLN